MQLDWGESVVCNSMGEGEVSSPVTWPHPDSMEPVTKDQNNSIKMDDHWKVKILQIIDHEVWVYCTCFFFHAFPNALLKQSSSCVYDTSWLPVDSDIFWWQPCIVISWQYPIHDQHISAQTRPTLTKWHFLYFCISESSHTLRFQNHYVHHYKERQGREDCRRERGTERVGKYVHTHILWMNGMLITSCLSFLIQFTQIYHHTD